MSLGHAVDDDDVLTASAAVHALTCAPVHEAVLGPVSWAALREGKPSELNSLHAQALLRTLIQERPGRTLPWDSVHALYADMCFGLRLAPRPYNRVAAELAKLTREKGRRVKRYESRVDTQGKEWRERVYIIPSSMPGNSIRPSDSHRAEVRRKGKERSRHRLR